MNNLWIIVAASCATIFTRLSVLWLPKKVKESVFLDYLSQYLPAASFGLLVVYSLKDVSISDSSVSIPTFIALCIVVLLQVWKDNMIVSIFVSSTVYIILINFIF